MYKKFHTTLLIILLSSSFLAAQNIADIPIMHDGVERKYSVYLPVDYQDGMQLPLVFNLHGFGSNGLQQTFYTAFVSLSLIHI